MSDNVLDQFNQQEAENIALSVKLNRWSQVMIAVLIREQEQKLMDSDQPVDAAADDGFWEGMG